jgi:Pectate lyase superfamily protein
MPITDYNTSAASNLTLGSIPIGPGMEREKVNNALQQILADIAAYKNSITGQKHVKDNGAVGDGVADDTNAILNTAIAARTGFTDGLRTFAGEILLPPGKYLIDDILDLAPAAGVTGLTISGSGAGSTEIIFSGSTATIKCTSSSLITWRDVSFVSSGVDDDQVAFTIAQVGNPLRSWRFERCNFNAFYKAFAVTGTSMCSEFYLDKCKFQQCYIGLHNDNDQAVNWNATNCDWENAELDTVKDKDLSAAIHLKKGSFVHWEGGSFVYHGMLVYYDLTASGVFTRTSHKVIFDNIRQELVDDGAGGHAPLIDRVSSGYTNGGNSPTTTIQGGSILFRGSIPTTITIAKVWANCSLRIVDVESEGGKVIGILDGVTAASNADVVIKDVRGITYEEDITARVNTHDQHNVSIQPDNSTNGTQPLIDLRLASLSVPSTAYSKRLYVRGPTGSIPQGGTTVNLPTFNDHTFFVRLFCYRSTAAGEALTVLLRDQADTTTYGTLTIGVGVSNLEAYIGEELGADIPAGTALMLKFTGTPEIVKGVVGFEYL